MKFKTPISMIPLAGLLFFYMAQSVQANEKFITRQAEIESIDILILESFPVQVHVRITGAVGDSCTILEHISPQREASTFVIEVTTKRPVKGICPQMLALLDETVPLDVAGLKAGTYMVDVNGIKDTFVLSADNLPPRVTLEIFTTFVIQSELSCHDPGSH